MRKTIRRELLVSTTNILLSNNDISQDCKEKLCTLVEAVLLNSSSYNGFQYLFLATYRDEQGVHMRKEYSRQYL